MKSIVPAILLSLIPLTAQSALAEKSNFNVYNSTGYTVERLYVSESSYTTWGPNLLHSGVLPSTYNTNINFGNSSRYACMYDFRAVFSNGAVLENRRVNVCQSGYLKYYPRSRNTVYQ